VKEWWEGLNYLQRIFYYFAFPATALLLLQTILTIFGIGGEGDDADVIDGGGIDADAGSGESPEDVSDVGGFRFFSIRGFVAFFCVFGWAGAAMSTSSMAVPLIVFIAAVCGFAAMVIIAGMFYGLNKLQSSGNINYRNALGATAEVYIPIPPKRTGMGKIQVSIQERLIEAEAMTDSPVKLSTGMVVRITDIISPHIYIVEKIK
jgi:hypothetical protein